MANVTHTFVSAIADDPASASAGEVLPSHWNANHTVTLGADENFVTDAQYTLIDGITASAAEINILDGATLSTTELNYVDGVTSAIQTQLNAKGDVTGPASATDNAIARYDGTTGKLIQNSVFTINDTDTITGPNNARYTSANGDAWVGTSNSLVSQTSQGRIYTDLSALEFAGLWLYKADANTFEIKQSFSSNYKDLVLGNLKANGKVSIGTTTQDEQLFAVSNSGNAVFENQAYSGSATGDGVVSTLRLFSARGTNASPANTVGLDATNPSMAKIQFGGYGGGDADSQAEIRFVAGGTSGNGTWGAGGRSTQMEFYTTKINQTALTKAMTIRPDGQIDFNVSGFSFPASGTFSPPGNIVASGGFGYVYTHPLVGTVGFYPTDGSVVGTHVAGNIVRIDIDSDNNETGTYFVVGQHHLGTSIQTNTDALFYVHDNGGAALGVTTVVAPTSMLDVVSLTSGRVTQILRAAASQTVDIFQAQNSSSQNLAVITKDGAFIFNEQGLDADCRIEGDTDVNLLFTDASTDRVGIGTASPGSKLDVAGSFQCDSITNDTGLAAGTYTPTRSAEANLDSNVTMTEAQYMRVGNTVTVSGRFTADPTLTATTTSFEITLPVASNLGAAEDAAGVAFCGAIAGMGAEITGSAANNTAVITWKASDVTSQSWSYQFTYQVI